MKFILPKSFLEKRLFEIICLIQMIIFGHGAIQALFLYGPVKIFYFDLFTFLQGALFFYLSYKRGLFKKLVNPFIFLLFFYLCLFWILLGGYTGQIEIGAIAIGLAIIVLSNPKHRIFYLFTTIIVLVLLVVLQNETNFIKDNSRALTLHIDYLVISISIFFVINFVKSEYDKERKFNAEQKKKLEKLNRKLNKMLVEKEQAINDLNETKDKLIESEKLATIGKLTSGIAHELNNPLNYIGGVVTPLKRDIEDLYEMLDDSKKGEAKEVLDEIKTLMDQVENGSRKANDIIRNLKSYVPTENNGISKYLSPLDISMEIEALINSQKRRHPNTVFHSHIEPGLEILANKFDLDQAITNILNNAVEAIPENRSGKITITLAKTDNSAFLTIADNGKGIKQEHIKEVMEPFFTTKEQGQGTGLGLFSAYNIIKKHSGDITIESELGTGTTIEVFLPFE